ncbi:MAG TPA: hypothetical protein VFP65_15185 [Anaeromyxobacteraceae bacterium]|nr:hypothetical protein [Anaeromyxobacteraceae bacterium]
MLESAWNLPLVRDVHHALLERRFAKCLEDEAGEEFLELLLRLLSTAIVVDPDLRRRAAGFEARFAFRSGDGRVTVGAVLHDGFMRVGEHLPAAPNVTVVFKDGRALMRSLLSAEPDLLGALLRQEVSFEGNLNYVYRLAHLARRLQLRFVKPG